MFIIYQTSFYSISCPNSSPIYQQTNQLLEKEKGQTQNNLNLSFSVPRPAFEIIKVGKNVGKKKNAEKRHNYTVFQYVIILLNFNPS